MTPAVNLINQANSEMQALNSAAEQAGALVSDIQTQINLVKPSVGFAVGRRIGECPAGDRRDLWRASPDDQRPQHHD